MPLGFRQHFLSILQRCSIKSVGKLTVDEPDRCHGDREESVRMHLDLDQSSSEGEEEEDDDHADGHTDALTHPAERITDYCNTTQASTHSSYHNKVVRKKCVRLASFSFHDPNLLTVFNVNDRNVITLQIYGSVLASTSEPRFSS